MKILQNRTNLTTKAANVFIMRNHMHNIQNIKSLENTVECYTYSKWPPHNNQLLQEKTTRAILLVIQYISRKIVCSAVTTALGDFVHSYLLNFAAFSDIFG